MPAISVIIPLYNAENFIGACLYSIFGQTFQDFEIIAVDDCSTDRSAFVVEKFIPMFNGKLKLLRMEKNSGGAGIPSNVGIKAAQGKYVYFVDNDDLLTINALEQLYNVIEEYDADAVQMDNVYEFLEDTEQPFPDTKKLKTSHRKKFWVDVPTPEPENFGNRIDRYFAGAFTWQAWAALVKREVLIDNEMTFPNLKSSTDIIWTLQLILAAKKFYHIPNACYVYRHRQNSTTRANRSLEETINFWTDVNLRGIEFLMKYFERQKFFKENPKYQWAFLEYFNKVHFDCLRKVIKGLSPEIFYKVLQQHLTEEFGEHGSLIAYLLQTSNVARYNFTAMTNRAKQLEEQLREK